MNDGKGEDLAARPLLGRRILITRPKEGASRMGEMLADLGACVRAAPIIQIGEPDDWGPLDATIHALEGYAWIIFTSANGPRYLSLRLEKLGIGPEVIPEKASLLAIGPATASSVKKYLGRTPDRVAKEYAAEGVVALLAAEKVARARVLLPRAKEGRDAIPRMLLELGAVVDDVAAYQTTPLGREALREVWGELEVGKMDMLTFTSSSALTGFVRAAGEGRAKMWIEHTKVASIGPATTRTAREWGIEPDLEAAESTISGMARAIVSFYRKSGAEQEVLRPSSLQREGHQN